MTTIRRITTSQVEGDSANNTNTSEIRPFGETAFYIDNSGPTDKLTLMMFDGARTHLKSKVLSPGVLYGSNADSGDGVNLDTIKLIPDAALYDQGSQQYLVVDPTTPNHIHLRAGGMIDNSTAQLFIGGENSHLTVFSGESPEVQIRANNNVWGFGVTGGLTFPDNTVQTTAFTGATETLASVTFRGATTGDTITVGGVVSPTVNAGVSAQVGYNITGTPFPEGAGAGFTWTWTSSGSQVQQLIALGNSLIGATVTQSEFPETATVLALPNLGGSLGIELSSGITYSPTNTLTFTSSNYAPPAQRNLTLTSNGNNLVFSTTGTLTAPKDITVPVGYGFKTTDAFQITAGVRGQTVDVYETLALCNNRFYLYTNWGQVGTGGQKAWAFNEDGSITFPDASSQTTAYTGAYTPATPADWAGTPPTTIAEAIDRLAARIKLIDGGTGA